MKLLALGLVLVLTGCSASAADNRGSAVRAGCGSFGDIEGYSCGGAGAGYADGAAVLHGQGTFTSGSPAIGMCSALVRKSVGERVGAALSSRSRILR